MKLKPQTKALFRFQDPEAARQFKVFRMTVRNQNLTWEEIRRRMNSGNACYCSILNLLSSHLLSKHIKSRIYETKILPVV
jgi:hypothetical protein